ncbi:MAG TPA: hydrogen gas-evolving membrane-bound hydrogenase subunit E [Vicinamibacterales bacterium]
MTLLLLILSPFALALPAAWLVRRAPRAAGLLALWPALLVVALAAELRGVLASGPRLIERAWAPSLGLTLSINLDALGLIFALLITGIGTLVVLYASRYLDGHPQAGPFFAMLFAFMGAMLGVALSDNLLTLFVFWELTGFTSFLLIGFDHEQAGSRAAAIQALIVTGAGGLALLAAGVLAALAAGTTSLSALAASGHVLAAHPAGAWIAALVLLAAFTKSAQTPFHFWLPNAMAAPTPVSAYLHSATMVKAGVYLIARTSPALAGTAIWMPAVTSVGALTMIVGTYRAVQETDLKRILAYSTVGALGILTMLLGVGTEAAVVAALVYLLAHAGYKGALFLVAGAVDHETGTRDVTMLGGLRRAMPRTAIAGGLAALSMAGVPLTLGFVGKDAAYEALLHGGTPWFTALLALLVAASVLMGLAGLLAGVGPFAGQHIAIPHPSGGADHAADAGNGPVYAAAPDGPAHAGHAGAPHEPAWAMWAPPLLLASLGLAAGLAPALLNGAVSSAATAVLGRPAPVELAIWHGVTPALGLSLITLAGVYGAWFARGAIGRSAWHPGLGFERIYTGALAALDATSRVIAPPLHSASLRSYVMAIVLTSIVVGGVALTMSSGIQAVAPEVHVLTYEALIVVIIISGALAATLAKSTMAAVLSLGAVGYGVALTFLEFGAPDLAMTQFSVETLTVVIYVLVFRHFRALGALSPRLVRLRDASIAIGIGTLIATLVLAVATFDTSDTLREYFVEHAAPLGHGLNVVNVILVDFRGFDTLGEITVLSTAAIGVRALLLLASAGRRENAHARKEAKP